MSVLGWLGLGNGLLNTFGQIYMSERQLQAQRDENEKNRQFNAEQAEMARQFNADEAQKARDYNSQMVNEQNAYNSPSAMMSRLQDAGLNPNLVYGDLGNASVGIGSASMAAGSPAANMSAGVGTALPSFTNAAKDMAEVELLKAQARNIDSNTVLNEIEAQFRPQLLQGSVNLTGINIEVGKSVKNLNEAKQNEVCKNAALADERIKEVQSSINLNDTIAEGHRLDNLFKSKTFDNAVQKFVDECDMTHQEAQSFAEVLSLSILNQKLSNSELSNRIKVAYETWRGLISDNKGKSWKNKVLQLEGELSVIGINLVHQNSALINKILSGVAELSASLVQWLNRPQ